MEPVSQYVKSLEKVSRPDTVYLITSCNFTEDELIRIFHPGEAEQQTCCPSVILTLVKPPQASQFTKSSLHPPFRL
jgi:hypothetical protein